MKTKKLSAALLLALTLISCNKKTLHQSSAYLPQTPDPTEYVTFHVGGSSVAQYGTKADNHTAGEVQVNSVQVLVFNANGSLNGYGSATSSSSCQVKISRAADLKCYAVVNMADTDLSSVQSETELLAKTSSLGNNSLTSFHMIGYTNHNMSEGTSFPINVSRCAAKVTIDKVTKAFTSAALASQTFKVTGIYLINVNSTCNFSKEAVPGNWYNAMMYKAEDNANGMLGSRGLNQEVTTDGWNCAKSAYCYPNPTVDDAQGGDTFTPRHTRLVVETVLGGNTYYYPVDIFSEGQGPVSNTHYRITNMVITGLGSNDPDVKPDVKSVDCSVVVEDWVDGFSQEITY